MKITTRFFNLSKPDDGFPLEKRNLRRWDELVSSFDAQNCCLFVWNAVEVLQEKLFPFSNSRLLLIDGFEVPTCF